MSMFKRSWVALAALLAAAVQAATTTLSLDVGGIWSNDELGSPDNEVRMVAIGADAQIIGVGWDVTLYADFPSWLSELSVDLSGADGSGVSVSPGFGADYFGMESFFSDMLDLRSLGLDFGLGADGMLRLEFFDAFDDYLGDWDGAWLAGSTLFIQYESDAVPEPATYGLAALGLLGAGLAGRRRRAAASKSREPSHRVNRP